MFLKGDTKNHKRNFLFYILDYYDKIIKKISISKTFKSHSKRMENANGKQEKL